MVDYHGKVVAITGAASGIGRGLANRFGKLGAKLSLADINEAGLLKVADELKAGGVEVIATKTDVSIFEDMKKFDLCGCPYHDLP